MSKTVKMPLPFQAISQFPIDTRLLMSKAEMVSISDLNMPSKYFAICADDGILYTYDKSNTIDKETGKFRPLKAGAGEVSAATVAEVLPDALKIALEDQPELGLAVDGDGNIYVDLSAIKNLYDPESLVYLSGKGLSIKNYDSAADGQMLVKDKDQGLVWTDPVSTAALQEQVAHAYQSAQDSATSAQSSSNYAIQAADAAANAQKALDNIAATLAKKFWWGTVEEYNALPYIEEGTFYFVML